MNEMQKTQQAMQETQQAMRQEMQEMREKLNNVHEYVMVLVGMMPANVSHALDVCI